jgi:flagellar motor switch protein FliM
MIGVMGAKEDILGQDEIDALMRGMGGVQVGEDDSVGRTDVVLYDFTNQERVVRGKFPALDVIAERFARCFQRRLIDMVQVGVEISSGEIKVLKMNEYLRNLSFPTSLNIIKIEVLGGLGLFAINSKLIFNAIDLYYGGNGQVHFKIEGREYKTLDEFRVGFQ